MSLSAGLCRFDFHRRRSRVVAQCSVNCDIDMRLYERNMRDGPVTLLKRSAVAYVEIEGEI
jgi:hypothetical protein